MMRVLVVCSVHDPQRASPAELHWLLGRLRPDALFIEHPSTDISSFRDGSCGTLESVAVMGYLSTHEAALVPVDIDAATFELPAVELKTRFDEMFHTIAETHPRYKELEYAHSRETDSGGLAYLNSALGWLREAELRREMRSAVEIIGERHLTALYELWMQTHDRRERAMVTAVENYARARSFKKGVLLVGSAHRQALIEHLQQPRLDGHSPVTWEFEWELDDSSPDSGAPS
jgi:hypothetical protein